jgi:hypothetical protein
MLNVPTMKFPVAVSAKKHALFNLCQEFIKVLHPKLSADGKTFCCMVFVMEFKSRIASVITAFRTLAAKKVNEVNFTLTSYAPFLAFLFSTHEVKTFLGRRYLYYNAVKLS